MRQELLSWLAVCGVKDIKAATLKIPGYPSFSGAYYIDRNEPSFYFVGDPPVQPNTCYACQGKVIYITGHMLKSRLEDHPEYKDFHPFGPNFTMRVWQTETMGEIDLHKKKPYKRIPAILEGITL
jgi:hypothetical protein